MNLQLSVAVLPAVGLAVKREVGEDRCGDSCRGVAVRVAEDGEVDDAERAFLRPAGYGQADEAAALKSRLL